MSVGLLGWLAADRFMAQGIRTPFTSFPLIPPPKLARSWRWPTSAAALLVAFLTLPFLAAFVSTVLLLGAWYFWGKTPDWRGKFESQKRISGMRRVFPQTLGMVIQSLKTGQTFSQVLDYLSKEGPSPLKEEWVLVCAEMNLGASADQALAKMKERLPSFNDLAPFLESYNISRQTGANLILLLEVLLEGMEEKNRILRKMETLTAQARLSGLMIGLLPFLLAGVFFIMDPSLILPLFTERIGWALLLLAGLLETIGFAWIRQLLRIEV